MRRFFIILFFLNSMIPVFAKPGWDPVRKEAVLSGLAKQQRYTQALDDSIFLWEPFALDSLDVLEFGFGPDGETIYAATRNGVRKSVNGGTDWDVVSEPRHVLTVACHPQNPDIVLAGTYDDSLYRSDDGGQNWQTSFYGFRSDTVDTNAAPMLREIPIGPTVFDITFDPFHSDTLMLATKNRGVFRSGNAGATWAHAARDTGVHKAYAVIADPHEEGTWYQLDTDKEIVYKTVNWGDKWSAFESNKNAISMAVHPADTNLYFLGCLGDAITGDQFYLSDDGGGSYKGLNVPDTVFIPMDSTNADSIIAEHSYKDTVLLGDGDTLGIIQNNKIITDILPHPDSSNIIYIATAFKGVYATNDTGRTWISLGMDTMDVLDLQFHPKHPDILLAATNGFGIRMFFQDSVKFPQRVSVQLQSIRPVRFALFQNYPNPFNAGTEITFHLSRPGYVKVQIYNILGQKVRTLFDARLLGGRHSLVWDGRGDHQNVLASGMYVIRMETGGKVLQRKCLMLK